MPRRRPKCRITTCLSRIVVLRVRPDALTNLLQPLSFQLAAVQLIELAQGALTMETPVPRSSPPVNSQLDSPEPTPTRRISSSPALPAVLSPVPPLEYRAKRQVVPSRKRQQAVAAIAAVAVPRKRKKTTKVKEVVRQSVENNEPPQSAQQPVPVVIGSSDNEEDQEDQEEVDTVIPRHQRATSSLLLENPDYLINYELYWKLRVSRRLIFSDTIKLNVLPSYYWSRTLERLISE
jgi:hypothetical protein